MESAERKNGEEGIRDAYLCDVFFPPGDSLAGSLDSLLSSEIEDLDCDEFGLPNADDEREPSLQEALRCSPPPIEEWLSDSGDGESAAGSSRASSGRASATAAPRAAAGEPLYLEASAAASRQLLEAERRGEAGAAVSLAAWRADGAPDAELRLAAGTLRGRVLAWRGAALRWATAADGDGAATALAWRGDGERLLVCRARGAVVELEAARGRRIRRLAFDATPLAAAWAGATSAVALDAAGAAWLLRFSRVLGSRALRRSRIQAAEAGSALAAAPLETRALALAGSDRLLLLCGARACSASLRGASDSMPLLCWKDGKAEKPILISARGHLVQTHSANLAKRNPSLTPLHSIHLNGAPLIWMGELEDNLILLNSDERMFHYVDRDQPQDFLDLSSVKIVYGSSFYKGVWSGGAADAAVSEAGAGAAGGALATAAGALFALGRGGVARVRRRDSAARAAAGRWAGALRAARAEGARPALDRLREALHADALRDADAATAAVDLCLHYAFLENLWGEVWSRGGARCAAERLSERKESAVAAAAPPASLAQDLLDAVAAARGAAAAGRFARSLAGVSPANAAEALQWCSSRGRWEAAAAVCAATGGAGAPLRALAAFCCRGDCGGRGDACPGGALLRHTGRALASERHAERYEALDALLRDAPDSPAPAADERRAGGALGPLLAHATPDALLLLHNALQAPPFVGPLGRHNRQRLLRTLADCCSRLEANSVVEILEFINRKIADGIFVADRETEKSKAELTSKVLEGENVDEATKRRLRRLGGVDGDDDGGAADEPEPAEDGGDGQSAQGEEGGECDGEGLAALEAAAARASRARAALGATAREASALLRTRLRTSARAIACGALCCRCRRPLAASRALAAACGHAWHAACDAGGAAPPACVRCHARWPLVASSPRRAPDSRRPAALPRFDLCLAAPPRTDVEGTL